MDTRTPDEIRADLAYLLDKSSQGLAARMAAALDEVGLTVRSFCVLLKAQDGSRTQGQIAELVLLDKTTMVVTLDALEKAGLAERVACPRDRRARLVRATGEGNRVIAEARAIVDGVYDEVLGVLEPARCEIFLDALVELVGPGGILAEARRPSRRN